jgi:DNA-directed RNA polymerase sigma subunit (sigma70/sigma32)
LKKVATDKKYCLFWLWAKGKAYKEVGRICEVSGEKVRQVFDKLLSKIEVILTTDDLVNNFVLSSYQYIE